MNPQRYGTAGARRRKPMSLDMMRYDAQKRRDEAEIKRKHREQAEILKRRGGK